MIEFRNVTKRFEHGTAIEDLSFAVEHGAFCVLIGTSGSGKSTTLRMVNRLIEPTSGSILLHRQPVSGLRPVELRRRIGYVIQSVGLFPHWTVARNIGTVPRLLRWPRARIDARVDELLELLQLDSSVRDRHPHQLSGGQQQRVGVARALAADPDVLLMDEPFGALDPITRSTLQAELARIHRRTGKTILFVTHDIDEALKLGSHIIVLDRGRIVQSGTPREIVTLPVNDFVRDFAGGDDRGLRLLEIETAADAMREVDGTEGEPILGETPLDRALSLMVTRRVDRLNVVGADRRAVGTLHLADFARL
jgi:osmoprotectant transport system ATP-binding protein